MIRPMANKTRLTKLPGGLRVATCEMPHAETALSVLELIDQAHHGGVGGTIDAAFRGLVLEQIHGR